MKNTISLALVFMAFTLLVFSSGCDDTCEQEGSISIDQYDTSPPEITWQIITVAPISDTIVAVVIDETNAPSTEITVQPTDNLTIRLKANDDQSGIQWLEWSEISAFACTNGSETINLDNFLFGIRETFPTGEDDCAFQEVNHSREATIAAIDLCPAAQPELGFGNFIYQGKAANANGIIGEATLRISIASSEL